MSLRIAFVTSTFPDFPDCAAGFYAGALCRSLAELNHDVHVITSAREEIKNTFNKVTMYKVMQTWGILEFPRIIQTLMQIKPDILHINHPTLLANKTSHFLIQLLPEANQAIQHLPVITTLHGFLDMSLVEKIKILPMLISSDTITVPNLYSKEKLKKFLPSPSHSKIEVIDNSVPFDFHERSDKRDSWGLNKSDKVLGFANDLTPEGGFNELLEIFAKLKQHDPSFKLFVLSRWTSAVYRMKMLSIIEKEKLQNSVILTGSLNEKEFVEATGLIDLFVFPGNKPIEKEIPPPLKKALLLGIPALVSAENIGYSEFGFKHCENILFTALNNKNALIGNIVKFFSETELAHKIADNAKSLSARFSFENTANQMSRIYSKHIS